MEITPVGWMIVMVSYAMCGGLLYLIWRSVRTKPFGKPLVSLLGVLALIAPLADEIWINWHFKELCKGAGVHVIRKVTVEGFLEDISPSSSASDVKVGLIENPQAIAAFEEAGFRFHENSLKGGKVRHLERVPEGLRVAVLDTPHARYRFTRSADNQKVGHNLQKDEYEVIDMSTGEVLGRRILYKRYPGWVDGLWIGLLGSGLTMCPDPSKPPYEPAFPGSILLPPTQKQRG